MVSNGKPSLTYFNTDAGSICMDDGVVVFVKYVSIYSNDECILLIPK